jgi:hypothetical protein
MSLGGREDREAEGEHEDRYDGSSVISVAGE